MKIRIRIIIAMILCFATIASASPRSIKPTGNIVSKEGNFSAFDNLEIKGTIDVDIVVGNALGYSLKADDALINFINIQQGGTSVKISAEKAIKKRDNNTPSITITIPNIDAIAKLKISLTNMAKLNIGSMQCKMLNVVMKSSFITLSAIEAKEVYIDANNESKIDIAGNIDKVKMTLSKQSTLVASALIAEKAEIELNKNSIATITKNSKSNSPISIKSEELDIELNKESKINIIDLATKELNIECNNESIAEINGNTKELDAEITKSSTLHATGLSIKTVEIKLDGKSTATIGKSEIIRFAQLKASSTLTYSGSPDVKKTVVLDNSHINEN
ncbi:MAG: DUF2807 domain-containing protein [Bacteroidales bacterium]|nr:DUF2807 domain-containing protein [Bacteroidales bacterium]